MMTAWWNSKCQSAWLDEANWLYTGTFSAGKTAYVDEAIIPATSVVEIQTTGGTADFSSIQVNLVIAPDTFDNRVVLTQFLPGSEENPPHGQYIQIREPYRIISEYRFNMEQALPTQPYTLTVGYDDTTRGPAIEASLAAFFWDGYAWVADPSSVVDTDTQTITAHPQQFGLWTVLGTTNRSYLPLLRLPSSQ